MENTSAVLRLKGKQRPRWGCLPFIVSIIYVSEIVMNFFGMLLFLLIMRNKHSSGVIVDDLFIRVFSAGV